MHQAVVMVILRHVRLEDFVDQVEQIHGLEQLVVLIDFKLAHVGFRRGATR